LVFTQVEHFGVGSTDPGVVVAFGLSELGDEAYLASAAGDVLTGFVVRASFTAADKKVTFGRQVNIIGEVDYVALQAATLLS